MDVTFTCNNCKQQLEAEVSLAGTQIPCPSCSTPIEVPEPNAQNIKPDHNTSSAAAREEHHFSVPVHDSPTEMLVAKTKVDTEAKPKNAQMTLRVKTIRRTDCVEVGHDRFDETVSAFLGKVGETNVVSLTAITYTHVDLATRQLMTDFGVLIAYKG